MITPAEPIADGADVHRPSSPTAARPVPLRDGTDLFDVGWQTDGREASSCPSRRAPRRSSRSTTTRPTRRPTRSASPRPRTRRSPPTASSSASDDTGHGTRSWTYEARDPMASYLVQVAIGDYELVDAGERRRRAIRHVVPPQPSPTRPRARLGRTAEMIELLDDVFGPVPVRGLRRAGRRRGPRLRPRDPDAHDHRVGHRPVGPRRRRDPRSTSWPTSGSATRSARRRGRTSGSTRASPPTPSGCGRAHRRAARRPSSAAASSTGCRTLDPPPGDPGADELFAPPSTAAAA